MRLGAWAYATERANSNLHVGDGKRVATIFVASQSNEIE